MGERERSKFFGSGKSSSTEVHTTDNVNVLNRNMAADTGDVIKERHPVQTERGCTNKFDEVMERHPAIGCNDGKDLQLRGSKRYLLGEIRLIYYHVTANLG